MRNRRTMGLKRLSLRLGLLAALAGTVPACAAHSAPDLSALSPVGLREYKAGEAIDIVNDVTTAVRAAVRAAVLPVAVGAQLLTVNKQVLDVLASGAVDWKARVAVILRNGRDALPPAWKLRADSYLQQVQVILQGAAA